MENPPPHHHIHKPPQAAIKELTGGDWTIKTEKIGFCNIKLTASDFAGVDLRSMSVVGPRVLRACRLGGRRPPKKLFGQVFALSHVVESIAHSAIATPKDAGCVWDCLLIPVTAIDTCAGSYLLIQKTYHLT